MVAVVGAATAPMTVRAIGDELAAQPGGPLTARSIQIALRTLADAGEADEIEVDRGRPTLWMGAKR